MKSVLLYNGFPENKIQVIPYFTELPGLAGRGTDVEKPVILALGRIVPEKGFGNLLRAFKLLKGEPRLVIVGDGPGLSSLVELAEHLNISSRVSFPGLVKHHELSEYFRKCFVVAVPSLWPEPFGIVGIEAMAYGKPVVAYESGGISEWLKDGINGFLLKVRDEKALAEGIQTVLNNPKLANEMGEEGRQIVKDRFTATHHIEKLIPLFEKAVDSFPNQKLP